MDSLTQIVLGGAIGAIIGGRKYGRKSVLLGAICGTVPDLDIIFFVGADPVTSMTYHRGFSHSILFAILGTPVLAWLFSKVKKWGVLFKDKALHVLIFLGLLTHMLLDSITIYGTQLFWPLPVPPVGLGSVFIIDLLYTLPMMIGVIWFLVNQSCKVVLIGTVLSTLYLGWGLAAQHHVFGKVTVAEGQKVLVQTTPFNTFLWRILVMGDDHYDVGYYSVFDKDSEILYERYERDIDALHQVADAEAVRRLKWFTKGFYGVKEDCGQVVISDLRMGLEPNSYIFSFIVGQRDTDNNIKPVIPPTRYQTETDMGRLPKIWDRIWREL